MKTLVIQVQGMTCGGCKMAIERSLLNVVGVTRATADFQTGQVSVEFEETKTSLEVMHQAIIKAGYTPIESPVADSKKSSLIQWLSVLFIGIAILVLSPLSLARFGEIPASIGFGALFGLGLMTSTHCIGMCGGINLSVTLNAHPNQKPWQPSLLYNLGRLTSYTLIGALLGAIGQVFSISTGFKAGISVIAGILIFLMGLKLIGSTLSNNPLQKLRLPDFFAMTPFKSLAASQAKSHSTITPYWIGLANGFMPCGPLQAMQLYALGTGSALTGALSMFFFSLGTIPLMFGFGMFATVMRKTFNQTLTRVSGILMIVIAVITLQRGLVLSNFMLVMSDASNPFTTAPASQSLSDTVKGSNGIKATLKDGYQEVIMEVTPRGYSDIIVQKGIPVKWILRAGDNALTGCNEAIVVPSLGIERNLKVGDTIVEFTAEESGPIPYSCWMGMIQNTIRVVDSLEE